MSRTIHHPFADLIGLTVESVREGTSHCRLTVSEALFNPHKVVHGGVLYSLADTGMGGAIYSILEEGELCATIDLSISYFKAVKEGTLECFTEILHRGKTVASLESKIFNHDTLAAKAHGHFSIFRPTSPA